MVGPGNIQTPTAPEGAGSVDGRGGATRRLSDPSRRSGFEEALRQMQAQRLRHEASERPPGLEERPGAAAADRAEGNRPGGDPDQVAEQSRDTRAAEQEQTGETQAARRDQEARQGDSQAADEAAAEATAERAGQAAAGDEEATEATKAAGAALADGARSADSVSLDGEPAPEVSEGEGSAWARFLERTGAQPRQSGGEGTMEFSSQQEQAQTQPVQLEPEGLMNPFDMLDVTEVMDPDLQIDTAPNQLLNRVQQAMQTTPNPAVLDEAAEVVLPQVVRGLVAMVRDGASEIRVQLQPADLGEIELRVRALEGVVRGEITVQNQEVRQLLESQLNRLRTALADQGLDLQDFDVGLAHDGRFSHPNSGGREAFGHGDNAPWRGGNREEGEAATAAAAPDISPGATAAADLGDHAVNYVI